MRPSVRDVNVVLGVWLFLSAFLWPHTGFQLINTWMSGLLCAVFALVARNMPSARHANTGIGIWLILSTFIVPTVSAATLLNNLLVGIGILVISLLTESGVPAAGGPRRAATA